MFLPDLDLFMEVLERKSCSQSSAHLVLFQLSHTLEIRLTYELIQSSDLHKLECSSVMQKAERGGEVVQVLRGIHWWPSSGRH